MKFPLQNLLISTILFIIRSDEKLYQNYINVFLGILQLVVFCFFAFGLLYLLSKVTFQNET